MSKRLIVVIVFIISIIITFSFGGTTLRLGGEYQFYDFYLYFSPWTFLIFPLVLCCYIISMNCENGTINDSFEPASLIMRFFALIIDFYITMTLTIIPINFILLIYENQYTNKFKWLIERCERLPFDSIILPMIIVFMFIPILLLLAFPSSRQKRTPGQLITGVIVYQKEPLSLSRSIGRLMIGFFGLFLFFWNVIHAILDKKNKQMWHDKIFKTFPKQVYIGQKTV